MREGWIYMKWADVLTIGMLIKPYCIPLIHEKNEKDDAVYSQSLRRRR